MLSIINVAVGIIVKNNKVFAARRKPGLHLAGFWEFPGGKIEQNESPEQCLERELREEFGIETQVTHYIGENIHSYNDKTVRLIAYQVEYLSGDFQLRDHDQMQWVAIPELDSLVWAEADIPLISQFKSKVSLTRFYQKQASSYAQETTSVDLETLYARFLQHLKPNAHILDLGCGSGRDSRYFLNHGFEITALDGSSELAKIAENLIKQKVLVALYQDMLFDNEFDAIWACASLLHCPEDQILSVLSRVNKALKKDGVFYASFKWGDGESCDALGRLFNNYTCEQLQALVNDIGSFEVIECWEETKPLRDTTQKWVNILVRKTGTKK